MDNQNTENNVNEHVLSSSEVIDKVLNAIGLTRDALSTYQQYQYPNGDYLRLRVSNHGIFLQHWFDKNREARMDGQNVPKLDVGINLAITFAPNEQECLAMGKPFPMKIKNVTAAKTQQGNNVKPQFKVRHICYYSWMLTQEDVDAISASLSNCITNGEDYKEPLQGNSDKVVEWEDTSNLPPKKVEGNSLQQSRDNNELNTEQFMNKKQIRLTESDLKQIVKESVNKILSETYGTVPKQDKVSQSAYGGKKIDKSAYSNDNEKLKAEYMQKLANGIYDVRDASEWFGYYSEGEIFGDSKSPSLKKYSDMIYNKIQEIENIYQQIKRIMTMKLGLQPDSRYDLKHLSMDADRKASYHDAFDPMHKVKDKDIPQDYMWYDQNDMNKHIQRNKDVGKGRTFTSV